MDVIVEAVVYEVFRDGMFWGVLRKIFPFINGTKWIRENTVK